MTKQCFTCREQFPLSEFYTNHNNVDGLTGRCKECVKRSVRLNYRVRLNSKRAYDKQRQQKPERRKAKLKYQRTYRMKYPEKHRATRKVAKAIEKGTLVRLPCAVCDDSNAEAHHFDYSRPLDIAWLCLRHHRQAEGRLVDRGSLPFRLNSLR